MQRRSENEKIEIIEDFRGINEVIDELKLSKDFVPTANGGYFNERAAFERLLGKQLHSSASTGGHILTIREINFSDRRFVLVHQSSRWFTEDDLSVLTSEPGLSPLSPTEPVIF